jgi:hypothetical protein
LTSGGRPTICLTRARGAELVCAPGRRQIQKTATTGSPLKRQHKLGAVEPATGEVVTIPRLPLVSGRAGKPPGWNRWSPAEKVEHLLGMSFDRMHDYLMWPADQLDIPRLAAQTQVMRVIVMAATKAGIEARRERDRQRAIKDMLRRWNAAEKKRQTLGESGGAPGS